MRTCPVCDNECNTMVCDRCGFDGSRDYERWPTVAVLKAPVASVAKRSAAFGRASEPEKKQKRRLGKRGKLILVAAAACLLIVLAVLLYHPWNGWFEKNGKTYYYVNGQKAYDFRQIDNHTYYFSYNDEGAMATGRVQAWGKYFYFDSEGVMQTGWQQPYADRDDWYYYDKNGVEQFICGTIDGTVYCVTSSWDIVTGLQTIDGKTYFFDEEGALQTDCVVTIDGVEYCFDENGVSSDRPEPDTEPDLEEEPKLEDVFVPETEATEETTQPTAPLETTPPATTPPVTTPSTTTPAEPEPTETKPSDDPNWRMCLTCVGKGRIMCYCVEDGYPGLCLICYGTGIYHMVVDYDTMETTVIECYGCDGAKVCFYCNGEATNYTCEDCGGNGGYYLTP